MGVTFGKSGSWVVDHTMDDIPLYGMRSDSPWHDSVSTISSRDTPPAYQKEPTNLVESPSHKRARKRSHWVAYTTIFVMSIGFSIVLSGVWPYLHELAPSLSKEYLGWVIASNPLGQMVSAPLLGLWGNKVGKIRGACLTTVFFFIVGNAMYALISAFQGLGDWACFYAMIISRFIVGVSSANVTLCRSYVVASTTMKERTIAISIIAASQALGFVIGPVIQAVLTMTIPDAPDDRSGWFLLDGYTAAGWVASFLGLINLILLTPYIFQEYNIAEKERELLKAKREKDENVKLPKPDYLALGSILFSFFFALFIYVLLETLAVPFVMDQYRWTEKEAVVVVGIALAAAGILSIGMYVFNGFLIKRFDERKVMLIIGFIPLVIGTFLFLPWGNTPIPPQICQDNNDTATTEMTTVLMASESTFDAIDGSTHTSVIAAANCKGCPVDEQEWCISTPQLPEAQLIIAFTIVVIGYPVALAVQQSIFSKILGPKPQGVWMGILTAVGSLSRILGPIFVSYVYTNLGTIWCFSILTGGMVLAFLDQVIMYRHFVPMKVPTLDERHAYDGPAAEKPKH
ncbi:major facilitator superfamily domain-containing protein 8-like [Panulirus ornatus]|uniref:major facilitator superfamily domain-containing protein 8-like n=1 Tax=Panulirus ornatus TaxID=150431 RepID=UPI003A8718FD